MIRYSLVIPRITAIIRFNINYGVHVLSCYVYYVGLFIVLVADVLKLWVAGLY